MKPTTIIYWTRACLGVVAALICMFLSAVGNFSLLNGITIALLIYIVTYYVYKSRFLTKVEKSSKIFTTGIGAYFLTWIVLLGVFVTLLVPIYTVKITEPAPNTVVSQGTTLTIAVKITDQFNTLISEANVTANSPKGGSLLLTETSPGIYTTTYNVTSSDPPGEWTIKVKASITGKSLIWTVTRERSSEITVSIGAGS